MFDAVSRLNAALEGRYEIERQIGQGAMATVYLARELKHGRNVAIKLLRPELAASIGAERFGREIEIAAQLQHPHIVPLYESGQARDFLFYVMPFVEGESLRDRLDREQRLPVEEALRIAVDVAEALSYAHKLGFVHRDIKPANILLHHGQAVVGDFGIARAVSAAGARRLTSTGLAVGTPTYMSPEQAGGDQDVDGRSDIYSLACVVYEALAGRPPFQASSAPALVAKHLQAPVPQVRELRPMVPEYTGSAIAKGLAKVPTDRFATATEFAKALTVPPAAGVPSRLQGRKRKQRRRLYHGVAILSVAGLGASAAWYWWPAPIPVEPNGFQQVRPASRVNTARRTMLDFKARALAADAPARADPAFELALRAEQRGETQLAAGDSIEALRAYDEAIDLFGRSAAEGIQGQATATRAVEQTTSTIDQSPPGPASNSDSTEERVAISRAAAEATRIEMLDAKERVIGGEDVRSANARYDSATQLEAAGGRQFRAGAFGAAQISYGQAKDLYEQAGIEIATRLRVEADAARRSMEEAKASIDSVGQTTAEYNRALTLERTADSAYDASGYDAAAANYGSVTELYLVIGSSPEAVARATGRDILRFIDRYEKTVEGGNFQEFQTLHKDRVEAGWSSFFDVAREIEVRVDVERMEVSHRPTPCVDLLIHTDYVDDDDEDQQLRQRVSWLLEQADGIWMISQRFAREAADDFRSVCEVP